jgi:hypothetical protein
MLIEMMSNNIKPMNPILIERYLPPVFFNFIYRAIIFALLTSSLSYGQLSLLETKDLRFVYMGEIHGYLVPHAARCFENAMMFHSTLFSYTPYEKVTVFFHDFNDYGNAGATCLPQNRVNSGIAPFSFTYETMPANERMNSIFNHELVHITALDQSSSSDRFFRSAFLGKVTPIDENPLSMVYSYLTVPRRYSPRWFHEGIAVFLETWMAGGYGRALGSYDEMTFRTSVKENKTIYDLVGLESEGIKVDFQVGVNSYLYGTRFMSYLALKEGPMKLINWVNRVDGTSAYFANDFDRVYGTSLDDKWSEWIEWEKGFQKKNLDLISANPLTNYKKISDNTLGSISKPYYDKKQNKIFLAVNYPGQVAHVASLDRTTGKVDRLCDIKGAALYYVTSLAYDRQSGNLFYTEDNNDWRDLVVLNTYTNKRQSLMRDERIGDLSFNANDSSLWGVRHYNGLSTLVRIPSPYNDWNSIVTFPYGRDLYDIDISYDGKYLVGSVSELTGKQYLVKFEIEKLLAGDTNYTTIFDFDPSIPGNFIFSDDGKNLFGHSYYSGVANIWRYNIETDKMEILSNDDTGMFRPCELNSDSLIVFKYTAEGFIPVVIRKEKISKVNAINFLGQDVVDKYPFLKKWALGSPARINLDSLTIATGTYYGLLTIGILSAYPIVERYKDYTAVGYRFNISDPVGFHNGDITVSYTPSNTIPKDERFHSRFNYEYMNWKVNMKYNYADFYDFFGPTKASRKGYSAGIRYKEYLLYDAPRTEELTLSTTYYGNLETMPDYQNVTATYDKFLNFSASFCYKFITSSLGSTDDEKGFSAKLSTSNNLVQSKLYPQFYTDIDYGFQLPLNHSSIWLRGAAGFGIGNRLDPFANFFFGGFGNNYIDYQAEKRFREYYSFPGVELNNIAGINFGKALVEWILPPIRFKTVGNTSFYLTWCRPTLFASTLTTNFDNSDFRNTVYNVGGQFDFRFNLLSHLKITLSAGYALAAEMNASPTKEWMLSLKIM